MQPESKDINYAEEKKLGNCVYIDDWIKELNSVIKHLQDEGDNNKDNDTN